MEMYQVLGQNNPGYLLADPQGADVIAIPVEPGNGTVKRGTVMYRKPSGMYAPAAEAEAIAANFLVVIDEDVNTTLNANVAEDARAYRAGRLAKNKVFLTADAAITPAIELVLRAQGIMLDATTDSPSFNNQL